MGLFSIFGSNKETDILQEMKDFLEKFMTKYASENPDDMEALAGVFANARMMVNSLTPKDAKKAMKQNGVDAACGVLNILQNYAMTEIRPESMRDILYGEEGEAYNLYMNINDEKLRLGYISKEQHQDNKRVGYCIRTGERPII